jgi:hypothetical protein
VEYSGDRGINRLTEMLSDISVSIQACGAWDPSSILGGRPFHFNFPVTTTFIYQLYFRFNMKADTRVDCIHCQPGF